MNNVENEYIGTIDLSLESLNKDYETLKLNEDKLGMINFNKGIGECIVEVRSRNEGPIPHFHIYNLENRKSKKYFHCCLFIFEPYFFDHNNQTNGKLNKDQLEYLCNWLDEDHIKQGRNTGSSKWEFIADYWVKNNTKGYSYVYTSNSRPDYTKAVSFKSVYKERIN